MNIAKKLFIKCAVITSVISIFFASCSNLTSDIEEAVGNVTFNISNYSNSSRTILPTTADQSSLFFTLKGALGSGEQKILPTTDKVLVEYFSDAEFLSSAFRLPSGVWNFTLEGYKKNNDEEYTLLVSGTASAEIKPVEEGQTNTILFTLIPVARGEGSIKVKYEYDLGDKTQTSLTEIVATLTLNGSSKAYSTSTWTKDTPDSYTEITKPKAGTTVGSGYFTFNKSAVPNGIYILNVKVTCSNSQTTNETYGYASDIVIVAPGSESTSTITMKIEQIYSIKFENMEEGETSYWKSGADIPKYYKPYETLTLPGKEATNHNNAVFDGWYTNSGFTGDAVTKIGYGTSVTSGAVTYYAKWRENIMYVASSSVTPAGSDSGEGTKESPYATVTKAISAINSRASNIEWTIYIIGNLSENITISSITASKLIIEGYNYDSAAESISAAAKDSITASSTAFNVSTTVPVTIQRLKITGGSGTQVSSTNSGGALLLNTHGVNVTFGKGTYITGGNAVQGAGIFVNDGSVLFDGGLIDSCGTSTESATEKGAGVYVGSSGSFIFCDGTISNNGSTSTTSGGGIYSEGTVDIKEAVGAIGTSRTVSGNKAKSGAGIYSSGSLTIDCTTIGGETEADGNKASNGNGGAIYASGSTNTITNSVIKNNTADGSGGGIFTSGATNTISNTKITGNSATNGSGGAIYNEGDNLNIKENATLSQNAASISGGAIYNAAGNITINNAAINNNTASEFGGAVYSAAGNLTFSSVIFDTNTATNSSGGAIYNEGGTLTLTSTDITNSSAKVSGGAIYNKGGKLSVTGGQLNNNTATTGNGGSVYNNTSESEYSSVEFTGNKATTGSGGAIYNNDGDMTLTNCPITDSTAGTYGGAVYNKAGTFTLSGCTIGKESHNNTAQKGGGIYNEGILKMTSGTVNNNIAFESGAGVYNAENATFTMSGGSISGNTATAPESSSPDYTGNGGGVYNNGTQIVFGDSIIGKTSESSADSNNNSNKSMNGAGIFNDSKGKLYFGYSDTSTVVDSMSGGVYYNYARGNGGGIYNGGALYFANGVIAINMASSGGGGIYNNNSMIMIGKAVVGDTSSHADDDRATYGSHSNIASEGGGIHNNTSGTLIFGTNDKVLTGGVFYNYASKGGGISTLGNFTINSGYINYNGVRPPEGFVSEKAGVSGTYTNNGTSANSFVQTD